MVSCVPKRPGAVLRACMIVPAGLALALMLAGPVGAQPAKAVFGAVAGPAPGPGPEAASVHGGYARGCLAGAVALPETGAGWQAMRTGRNRAWGHPDLIGFVGRLGRVAQDLGWPRIYVGDLSQPRGGPMASGHRSHQIGLDADIWFRRPVERPLGLGERETIGATSVVTRGALNARWTAGHDALLAAAATDPAVARIFVNAAIKRHLCAAVPADGDRAWLGRIRPWYGHDDHFHVRLHCPGDAPGCVAQAPVPAGDGCDATLEWWFSDEALHPKPDPGAKPRAPLTLADLPAACASVARW